MTPRSPRRTATAAPTRWQFGFAAAHATAATQLEQHHPAAPQPSGPPCITALNGPHQPAVTTPSRADTTTRTVWIRRLSTPILPSIPGVFDELRQ